MAAQRHRCTASLEAHHHPLRSTIRPVSNTGNTKTEPSFLVWETWGWELKALELVLIAKMLMVSILVNHGKSMFLLERPRILWRIQSQSDERLKISCILSVELTNELRWYEQHDWYMYSGNASAFLLFSQFHSTINWCQKNIAMIIPSFVVVL